MRTGRQLEYHPKILRVPANTRGNDFVIADLHGRYDLLLQSLTGLEKTDRLFIAGDLLDRGPGNLAIVEFIQHRMLTKDGPAIFCIRGNHECMALEDIEDLSNIALHILSRYTYFSKRALAEFDDICSCNTNIQQHSHENGGKWLIDLFKQELKNKKICLENGTLIYKKFSKIRLLQEFISRQPYITSVDNSLNVEGFNLAHAAMPVTNEQLSKILRGEKSALTVSELDYCIWTRPEEVDDRMDGQIPKLTYAGHTIVIENYTDCLRLKENLIDLDVGAYFLNAVIRVNHTKQCVEIIGQPDPEFQLEIEQVRATIEDYFNILNLIKILNTDCSITDMSKMHSIIQKAVAESPRKFFLPEEQILSGYVDILIKRNALQWFSFARDLHNYEEYNARLKEPYITNHAKSMLLLWSNASKKRPLADDETAKDSQSSKKPFHLPDDSPKPGG